MAKSREMEQFSSSSSVKHRSESFGNSAGERSPFYDSESPTNHDTPPVSRYKVNVCLRLIVFSLYAKRKQKCLVLNRFIISHRGKNHFRHGDQLSWAH